MIPEVRIFFVINDGLFIESTPMSEAESYGDCLIHPGNHSSFWEEIQRVKTALSGFSYDYFPRGRVLFNVKAGRYWVYVDRCTHKDTVMIAEILSEFHLPDETEVRLDSHYKCHICNPDYVPDTIGLDIDERIGGTMPASIPIYLLNKWIDELRSSLKETDQDLPPTEMFRYMGMSDGLGLIQVKVSAWLKHQENRQSLIRSGKKFMITDYVDLSDGRYRKLKWYEDDLFVVLAWLHAAKAERGELILEIQQIDDISKTFLVYQGSSSYDDLTALARVGGLESIRTAENQEEWGEKVWT